MNTLIVHESLFGNTREVADAIATALADARPPGDDVVRVVHVDDAPTTVDDIDLLLVGGPTHALGMTRPKTRLDAEAKGGSHAREGLREWIGSLAPRPGVPVVTFDTRVHVRLLPGSAASAAAKALRHRGFDRAQRGETFWVEDVAGPLQAGEIERARSWGAELATHVRAGAV